MLLSMNSHAEYMRGWRERNRDVARSISREASAKFRMGNLTSVRTQAVKHNDKVRKAILAFFGGVCVRCGFSDSRALQMDHINGDGWKERKHQGGRSQSLNQRYRFIVDDPDAARARYQLLCANCNSIKRIENREYANATTKRRVDE